MNRQVPDELISAYFDGEASPEERAAVESLLAESDAARRELDETAQLSALLHSFRRESAPVELAANVQRQTDQMPLAVQAASTPAAPARSLRREFTAAFVGALVTAASLLLIINVADRANPYNRQETARSDRLAEPRWMAPDSATTPAPKLIERFAELDGVTPRPMDDSVAVDESRDRKMAERESATGMRRLPTAPVAELQPDAPTAAALVDTPTDKKGSETAELSSANLGQAINLPLGFNAPNYLAGMLGNEDFLSQLKEGNVYTFVPELADPKSNVAVVQLQVVDVERGVDQIQVLLTQNSIRPLMNDEAVQRNKQEAPGRVRSAREGNDLVIIYANGPGDRLAKTLEEMTKRDDLVVAWGSQPSLGLLPVEEVLEQKVPSVSAADNIAGKSPSKDAAVATAPMDPAELEAEVAVNTLLTRNGMVSQSGVADNRLNYAEGLNRKMSRAMSGVGAPAASATAAADPSSAKSRSELSKEQNADGKQGLGATSKTRNVAGEEGAKGDATFRPYQTTFRIPMDASVPAEQAAQRGANWNVDSLANNSRRRMNVTQQAQEQIMPRTANSFRDDANRAVKMLLVIQAAPAPEAAAAPAGKPNP